jgi:CRISPR/Cas system CSM-associated protein Csm2 small subunit
LSKYKEHLEKELYEVVKSLMDRTGVIFGEPKETMNQMFHNGFRFKYGLKNCSLGKDITDENSNRGIIEISIGKFNEYNSFTKENNVYYYFQEITYYYPSVNLNIVKTYLSKNGNKSITELKPYGYNKEDSYNECHIIQWISPNSTADVRKRMFKFDDNKYLDDVANKIKNVITNTLPKKFQVAQNIIQNIDLGKWKENVSDKQQMIITLQNEINNYKDKFYKTIKKTIDIEKDFEKM